MNEKQIDFIICTNNEIYLNESMCYIHELIIPEGYDCNVLTIHDARCMTAGYQEGMESSDAKYKIYMHQDTFILNRYLLIDLLDIFCSNQNIGMIGGVGYKTISSDGCMWHEKRYEDVFQRKSSINYPLLSSYRYNIANDGYEFVSLIDGFFMATAYDFRWDIDFFQGWDFYDASQSVKFLKNGFRIVVPKQYHPWFLHDDNRILNLEKYDINRRIFMKEYSDVLGKTYEEI